MIRWKKRIAVLLVAGNVALLFAAGFGLMPLWGKEACGGICLEKPAPDFRLLTYRDVPLSLSERKGGYLLLFFGYSSCPVVCPTTLQLLSDAMAKVPEVETEVWFVSIDPERDGGEKLERWLENFRGPFTGLYGDKGTVRKTAADYNEFYARDGAGPDYEIDHSGRVYLIDPEGMLRVVYTRPDPEAVAADLLRLAGIRQ